MTTASAPRTGRKPLHILLRAIRWDLKLQLRYHIVTIAALVTALYVLIFQVVPPGVLDDLSVVLVFSDPTTIGFLFIGVLVMFERGAGTLQAVVVTPLSPSQYLWSKAISLSTIAVSAALVMMIAAHGIELGVVLVLLATALSSVFLAFLGFGAVARVRTVNAYLILIPPFLLPLSAPLLHFLGIVESPVFYLIPTQASFVLLRAAFEARPAWELVYGFGFLVVSNVAAFRWALRSFESRVRQAGG